MSNTVVVESARLARSRTTTLVIQPSDRGRRTAELDLALSFDPVLRIYHTR